jgi:ABC-type bacteriocin/lantibiotic exporter with double-glycine peptidase domain
VGAWTKKVLDRIANVTKELEETLDRRATVLSLKRSLQLDGYSCGAQSAYVILRHYGKARSIAHVTRELGTTGDGTTQDQIRTLLVRRGLVPKRINCPTIARLRQAIGEGCPVLVSVDDEEHWAVVYGYSPGHIFLADTSPFGGVRCRTSTKRFRARWDRWAMKVAQGTGRSR